MNGKIVRAPLRRQMRPIGSRPTLLIVAALSLAACARSALQSPDDAPAPITVPAPHAFADEIARFEAADRLAPPRSGGVLFVGSSSIRLWPAIEADFRGANVLQRGFGGSELSDVVHYTPRIVLPYRPRLIVLYAGDNDLMAGKSPATVFRDFQAFVALVRHALPATRIAFVAIKPSGSRWALVERMREANALVRELAATDPLLTYVDVFTPMLGPDGLPREELFVADRLHMNARGYALWREFLLPVVRAAGPQPLERAQPEASGFSAEGLARLTHFLRQAVDSSAMAGAVALVARNGRVAYEEAVGMADREAGRRMTPTTLFRIASQTKAITSVAAMILVEEGRLGLDDPVSRHVPGFASTWVATLLDSGGVRVRRIVPARRPITVRDLLTHTAGISYGVDALVRELYAAEGLGPRAGYGWYFADKREPLCASVERLATLPFVAQPGERWVYGYSTDVLACVVERAAGVSFAEFLTARITSPLGMRDTRFCLGAAERNRLAAVYALDRRGLRRADDGPLGQGDYVDGPCVAHSGGAGLLSTARDNARFLMMLAAGGALGDVRILSPASVAMMTRDQAGRLYGWPRGLAFGLGVEIVTDPARAGRSGPAGQFGWGGAYHTTYWVDPANQLVALLMTQLLPAEGSTLHGRFRSLVYEALVNAPGTLGGTRDSATPAPR